MLKRLCWNCWSPARLPRMKKLLALLIACLALTIVACGDDDDDDGGGSSAGTTTTEQKDTGGAKPTPNPNVEVDIKDIKFIPHDVTVQAGSAVQWTNSDQVPHTITWTDGPGKEFDSGDVPPGDIYEEGFEEKGKINYVCTIHPGQDGTITVK
jgi:plastocyanin